MQPIKTLNDMIVFLQKRGDKKRVAVVCVTILNHMAELHE